jgi:hypothetical protein
MKFRFWPKSWTILSSEDHHFPMKDSPHHPSDERCGVITDISDGAVDILAQRRMLLRDAALRPDTAPYKKGKQQPATV